jgi:predicted nucleotidyltransferase
MATIIEKRFLPKQELDIGSREALTEKLKAKLFLKEDITFAYLYGSFVKNEPFRDIDVAVYVTGNKGFIFESDLSAELTDTIGFDVGVRILNNAPIAFQMVVLREGMPLFSRDEDLRTDFLERVSKRYPEHAHFRNIFIGIDGKGCRCS